MASPDDAKQHGKASAALRDRIALLAVSEWWRLEHDIQGRDTRHFKAALGAVCNSHALCDGMPFLDWLLAQAQANTAAPSRRATSRGLEFLRESVADGSEFVTSLLPSLVGESRHLSAEVGALLATWAEGVQHAPHVADALAAGIRRLTHTGAYVTAALRAAPTRPDERPVLLSTLRGDAPADFGRAALLAAMASLGEGCSTPLAVETVSRCTRDPVWLVGALACEALAALSPGSLGLEGLCGDLASEDPHQVHAALDLVRRMAYVNAPLGPLVPQLRDMLGQGDLALQTETIGLLADLAYSPSNRAAALHALSAASSGGGLLGDLASSTIERLESDSTPWVSMTSVTLEALRSSAAGTVRTKKGDGSSGAVLVPARECSVLAVQAANRVVTDSMDGAYDRRRQAKLLECLYQSRALKSRQGLAEALLRPDGLTVICHGPAIHAVNLAVEFAAAVARLPGYCVRFGLSIGPVTLRRDVHGQIVVTGDGVSTAHIVAKHGDAGHVLASQYLVDKLTETDRRRLGLVDLGQRKYTDFMHVYNVTDLLGEYGRSEVPQGLIAHSRKMTRGTSVRRRRYAVALVLAAMVALAVAGYAVWRPDMCAEPGRRLLKLLRVSGTRNDPCTRDTPHAAPRRR